MTNQSLFGTIAARFSTQPENLATEALLYIINSSRTAERAFLSYVARAGVNLSEDLIFQTQSHGKDNSIPDLVGTNPANEQVLVIEAKFWASLTDNQPLTYLARLPQEKPGILLFIAPERRFPTLWAELLERLNRNEKFFQESTINDGFLVVRLTVHHIMALTSWRALLAVISQSAIAAQEIQLVSDVSQLDGLCARMDATAFIPLQATDLSSAIGMRVQQYYQMVDEIVDRLKREGLATTGEGRSQLRPTGGTWGYGRYFQLVENAAYFAVNLELWASRRETPFWLKIKGKDWHYAPEIKAALQYLEREAPSRLFRDDEWLTIPLYAKTGVEKSVILESILAQIREIAEKIKPMD